jgi:hypothetical protein
MGYGTARTTGSIGEQIHHLSHIRLRVTGSGTLKHTVYSLDDIRQKDLPNLQMSTLARIEPTKLTNFVEQRMSLEGYTTEINDYFRINRVVLFFKYYASEVPM